MIESPPRPFRRVARRDLVGTAVALGGCGVLTAAMIPVRAHLAIGTPVLVLVLPVVAAAVAAGFWAGALGALAGFCAVDLAFIPPYGTLTVSSPRNWLPLVVYALVTLMVARVVAHLRTTETEARRHADATRAILELSNALIADRPVAEFHQRVTATFLKAFDLRTAALLLPHDGHLAVVATAGVELSDAELAVVTPPEGVPRLPSSVHLGQRSTVIVPLSTSAGPLGLLALVGPALGTVDAGLLRTFANQVALALERVQLRDQAIRSRLFEEADRWRDALMGAVSHDLRTPLTVIKAAVENLRDPSIELDPTARGELLQFVEEQSDRLERLVVNILDMTRIRAGALTPRIAPVPVATLLAEALASLPPGIGRRVVSHLGVDDPVVAADHVLISQVLANYLDNADRHTQDASVIEVSARTLEASVEVRVVDHGPGVAPADRDRIFDMFSRVSGAGRAGLGLAIAKAFVEAHGGVVGVADAPGGGACFTFTIARAA